MVGAGCRKRLGTTSSRDAFQSEDLRLSQIPYEQRAVTEEMSLQAVLASLEESPSSRKNLWNL